MIQSYSTCWSTQASEEDGTWEGGRSNWAAPGCLPGDPKRPRQAPKLEMKNHTQLKKVHLICDRSQGPLSAWYRSSCVIVSQTLLPHKSASSPCEVLEIHAERGPLGIFVFPFQQCKKGTVISCCSFQIMNVALHNKVAATVLGLRQLQIDSLISKSRCSFELGKGPGKTRSQLWNGPSFCFQSDNQLVYRGSTWWWMGSSRLGEPSARSQVCLPFDVQVGIYTL